MYHFLTKTAAKCVVAMALPAASPLVGCPYSLLSLSLSTPPLLFVCRVGLLELRPGIVSTWPPLIAEPTTFVQRSSPSRYRRCNFIPRREGGNFE